MCPHPQGPPQPMCLVATVRFPVHKVADCPWSHGQSTLGRGDRWLWDTGEEGNEQSCGGGSSLPAKEALWGCAMGLQHVMCLQLVMGSEPVLGQMGQHPM